MIARLSARVGGEHEIANLKKLKKGLDKSLEVW